MQNMITAPAPQQLTTTATASEVVDMFLASLDVRQNSKDLYRRTLGYYLEHLGNLGYTLSDMTMPHLVTYRDNLLKAGKSSLTVCSYITAIKGFYTWTEGMRLFPNIARGLRSPKRKQQFSKLPLTHAQQEKLITHLQSSGNLRDYAIVNLLLYTGLRTIEVIRANVDDIQDRGGKRVLWVHGKGRDSKDDFMKILDPVAEPIAAYLEQRKNLTPGAPLFVSTSTNSKGERLNTRTIRDIVKTNLRAVGIDSKAFSAHSLRHTGATNILRATGSLDKTREFCRHSNPATTLIYTATLAEESRMKDDSGEDVLIRLFAKC
jgi:integrase/recombinase XerC/integrase/recombinase XerD